MTTPRAHTNTNARMAVHTYLCGGGGGQTYTLANHVNKQAFSIVNGRRDPEPGHVLDLLRTEDIQHIGPHTCSNKAGRCQTTALEVLVSKQPPIQRAATSPSQLPT